MPIALKQNTDGSAGLQGAGYGDGEFTFDARSWSPVSVSGPTFVASRDYVLKSIIGRVEVPGTDAGAVTAQIWMAPSGTALASGTALHTGTINLKGTAVTNQVLTGVDFTGTLTAAVGCISVTLCPA
jgi:hypothetical protein